MKSVLYINYKDSDKRTRIEGICALKRVRIEAMPSPEESGLPLDAELLVFRGFDDAGLKDFLQALRAFQAQVSLKCVETETNRGWPLAVLYGELRREHAAMQAR